MVVLERVSVSLKEYIVHCFMLLPIEKWWIWVQMTSSALPFHSRVVKVEIMIFLLTLKAVYPICLESLVLFSIKYVLKLFLKLVSTYLINFYILIDAFLLQPSFLVYKNNSRNKFTVSRLYGDLFTAWQIVLTYYNHVFFHFVLSNRIMKCHITILGLFQYSCGNKNLSRNK